ncbi:MAG: DUF481 domain-containing protein [Deltaproteobacteria bacterium]|nr:DUF481 domain-containing protein [Deltaproteobacteria bacterium]
MAVVGAVVSTTRVAAAQDVPKGSGTGIDAATEGKTEVAKEGQFQGVNKKEAEGKDATELSVSAGGMQASGNSRVLALTTAEKFRLRRGEDQFKSALAGNYAQAAAPGGSSQSATVQNLQALVRYDRFLGDFTLFLSDVARTDRFQGLNLRNRVDPGVGYYVINEKTMQLWGEVGYDFLYEIRRSDALQATKPDGTPNGPRLDKTDVLHSGRAFIGFEKSFKTGTKFVTGLEFLQGLSDTAIRRVNYDAGITAKLFGDLSIGMTFGLRYDNAPLPGKEKLDTTTAGSLVYTLL